MVLPGSYFVLLILSIFKVIFANPQSETSIFGAHNYDDAPFLPILSAAPFPPGSTLETLRRNSNSNRHEKTLENRRSNFAEKLSNPFEYQKPYNSEAAVTYNNDFIPSLEPIFTASTVPSAPLLKLSNILEFQRPSRLSHRPKYVTEAEDFYFRDYDDYDTEDHNNNKGGEIMRRSDSNEVLFPAPDKISVKLKHQSQRRNDLRFETHTNPSSPTKLPTESKDIFGIQQWLWHKFVPSTTSATSNFLPTPATPPKEHSKLTKSPTKSIITSTPKYTVTVKSQNIKSMHSIGNQPVAQPLRNSNRLYLLGNTLPLIYNSEQIITPTTNRLFITQPPLAIIPATNRPSTSTTKNMVTVTERSMNYMKPHSGPDSFQLNTIQRSSTTTQPPTTRVTQPSTTKPVLKVMQEEKEYVFQPQINKRFVKKPLIKSSNDLYIIEFDDYMKQIQDGVVKLKTNKLPMENIEEAEKMMTTSTITTTTTTMTTTTTAKPSTTSSPTTTMTSTTSMPIKTSQPSKSPLRISKTTVPPPTTLRSSLPPSLKTSMTTKGPETFHHRQIQKLHRFLSPNSGGLKLNLMLATLPSIRGSGIDFEKLTSKNSKMESITQNAKIHQQEFFMFHATLIQLQKLLEAVESVEVRPLVERMMKHNMGLIKLLFQYIVKSAKNSDKMLKVQNINEFNKHYRPLKEVFPFL